MTAQLIGGRSVRGHRWWTWTWSLRAGLLTMFDAMATGLWVGLGIAREGNPMLATMIDTAGLVASMLLRALIGLWLIAALASLGRRSRLARVALPVVTYLLGGVALWHVVGFATTAM